MRRCLAIVQTVALCCLIATTLSAQSPPARVGAGVQRISVGLLGSDADDLSTAPSLSEDGRFIAFQSYATNLVPGDANGCSDVFVRDTRLGTTTRVSVSSAGVEGNYYSGEPSISPDGRFVAFRSDATNLVPGDGNGCSDVFVHDLRTHTTTRVSVSSAGFEGNGPSGRPSISRDGRLVAFSSEATNLVGDDKNGVQDVFVRDRIGGSTLRIVPDKGEADGLSDAPSISADGRFVAFESRARAFGHGTNAGPDVFLCELRSRKVTLVSATPSGEALGGEAPAIARDGSVVVFESTARLLPSDQNSDRDVYAYRTGGRELLLASVSSEGASGRGWTSTAAAKAGLPSAVRGDSTGASVSADGRYVAFVSLARGLVAGDSDGSEVYVRDLTLGTTRCVRAAGVPGRAGPGPCVVDALLGRVDCPPLKAHLCANGTLVGFQGRGGLAGGNAARTNEDVYVAPVAAALPLSHR